MEKYEAKDDLSTIDIEGNSEILASVWMTLLQLELLLYLNEKPDSDEKILNVATKRLSWAQENILNKSENLTNFKNYLVSTATMFASNLATMNLFDSTLANISIETTCDFTGKGIVKLFPGLE